MKGLSFDWNKLYGEAKPRRISLPTYPFARERYWIEPVVGPAAAGTAQGSNGLLCPPPPLHRDIADLSGRGSRRDLNGDEPYLRVVNGARVLPDVAHLEMARAAVEAAAGEGGRPEMRLEQVEWLRPVVVGSAGLELHVELFADEDGRIGYEIYSGEAGSEDAGRVIHSRGWAVVERVGERAEASADVSSGTLLVKRAWQRREVEADAAPAMEQHWIVLCGREDWGRAVEAEIASALPQARCVVIAGGKEAIARRYEAGFCRLWMLLQRIVQDRPRDDVLIQAVVAVSGEDAVFAALSGLLKTARLEHPKLRGQVVAFEAQESAARIVERLGESARVPDEREVRYVGGDRLISSWHELPSSELPSGSLAEVPWRDGGVYLISGGAGGLGLIFAEEIARRVKDAVVVLTGRSELDEGKRAQLSALEGSGNRIAYRRVDVADSAAVTSLIASLREGYGGVNGILHAAGVIHDSFLIKKTAEEVGAVLAPKVLGVANLDEATADLTLEFMILFSSG